jgi:pimeloyl-ACP methyl ester carboxylesterase
MEPIPVSADGVSLAVHQRGEREAAPVLLVHGFPLDHDQWIDQLAGLDGWRRIAPDLRGAGGSDAPDRAGDYSMTRYADDLVAVLDAMDVERAACCGLSMGGYVLFELYRRHPGRVAALILCDTKAEPDTADAKRGRDELAAIALGSGAGAVADRLLPKLVGRSTRALRPELVETVRAMVLRTPVAGIVGALGAMRDRADSTPLLATIRVPTLVLCGEEDELTPAAGMRAMAEQIPDARYVEVASAGHLAPLEQPERVNAALVEFLRAL